MQIGSEVDPLLELARVKEEREKVFGKKSNFLRRRGLDPYAGIWTNIHRFIDILLFVEEVELWIHAKEAVCVWSIKPHIILRSACGVWLHPAVVVVSWSESETCGCLWDSLWSPIFRHWPPLHGVWFMITEFPEYISKDVFTQQFWVKSFWSPKYTLATSGHLKVKLQDIYSGIHVCSSI